MIRTSISTSTFIGDNFPEHAHENLSEEDRVIKMDGTFASTLAPLSQIYIVMARSEHGGQGLACGFALHQTKKSSTYDLLFNKRSWPKPEHQQRQEQPCAGPL